MLNSSADKQKRMLPRPFKAGSRRFWKIITPVFVGVTLLVAQQPATKGYKFINGVNLYYETMGEGIPIVIVHGGPGMDHSYLLPQMGELAKNYKLIFYDQRAMGKSSADFDTSAMTMNNFVEDLEGIRKAFGIEKMNLMGHSWGGLVSMFYAIKYPDHLQSLILVNTSPASSTLRDLSLAIISAKTVTEDSTAQAQLAQTEGFKKRDPGTVAKYFRLLFRPFFHNKGYADSLSLDFDSTYASKSLMVWQLARDSTLHSYDLQSKLDTVRCPAIIISGADDIVAPGTNEQIHEHIRGSQYILLPDCGHFPFIEASDIFFPTLRNFLKKAAG
ncbi:MAG: alpha/beta fold hydrolase [Bacteroidota bacterium]